MPALSNHGQSVIDPPPNNASAWFASSAGRAILDSESNLILRALAQRPAQPWLWLSPRLPELRPEGRGLRLALDAHGDGWRGPVRCSLPWPMASESFGTVVLQHVTPPGSVSQPLLEECARILSTSGTLWLFGLNPLAPYRWRWHRHGVGASEPLTWRRRLRAAGLVPEPVSQGIGPRWSTAVDADEQDGPGLRAAYALRADKRTLPLTPLRSRALQFKGASAT